MITKNILGDFDKKAYLCSAKQKDLKNSVKRLKEERKWNRQFSIQHR